MLGNLLVASAFIADIALFIISLNHLFKEDKTNGKNHSF